MLVPAYYGAALATFLVLYYTSHTVLYATISGMPLI